MNQHLKTTILLASLTGLLLFCGYSLAGQGGLMTAFIFSVVMNIGSYWFSDKMVLKMYKAKEITEKEDQRLHAVLRELCGSAGIPVPKLYMVNMPVPNAFATGRNPSNAAVALSPAIVELLDERELRGVIAHELGHIKNRDILISSVAATIAGALSYIAQMAYYGAIFGGGRDDNGVGGAAGGIAMIILAPIIASILHLSISRSREFLADEAGAKMSHDPYSLASALEKLHGVSKRTPLVGQPKHEATAHMFIVNPFKGSFMMSLFSTHPAMEERVKRLRAMRV